jgi:flagellar assembly protein FliH
MGEKVEPVLENLVESIRAIESLRPQLRHEAEEDVVKLSLAIARRVLHRELSVDPGALLGIVSSALKRMDLREVCRIRVHPSDVVALRSGLDQSGFPARAELVADATLARGGVIVETTRGELDASLETQLMEIERGLADIMSRKTS